MVRGDGKTQDLLAAHKGSYANELAASLGPSMVGEPESCLQARRAGDMLIVGTDGFFDVFPTSDQLAANIRNEVDRFARPFPEFASVAVDFLASHMDGSGQYVATDNISLAVLLTAQ